jgi:hypothetical protein
MVGLRVLPGTPLAASLQSAGRLPADIDYASPHYYFSPEVTEARVLEKIHRAIRRLPALVHGGEEMGSHLEKRFYSLLHAIGHPPPYVRFLPDLLRMPVFPWLRSQREPPPATHDRIQEILMDARSFTQV